MRGPGDAPVESCPEVVYSSVASSSTTRVPHLAGDFDEGETVRRLPGGHLIAAECFEQLLDAAHARGQAAHVPVHASSLRRA